jgi:hypothetical protein
LITQIKNSDHGAAGQKKKEEGKSDFIIYNNYKNHIINNKSDKRKF